MTAFALQWQSWVTTMVPNWLTKPNIFTTLIFTETLSSPRLDMRDWPSRMELSEAIEWLDSRQGKGEAEGEQLMSSWVPFPKPPPTSSICSYNEVCFNPFFIVTHPVWLLVGTFFLAPPDLGAPESVNYQPLMFFHFSKLFLYLSYPSCWRPFDPSISKFSQLYFSSISEFDHFSSFYCCLTGPNHHTLLPRLLQLLLKGLPTSTLLSFFPSILQTAARMIFLTINQIMLLLYWKLSNDLPSCS